MQKSYQERKDAAREQAKQWQAETADKASSWDETADANAYFEKLGKRYGLLTEFKENGIL